MPSGIYTRIKPVSLSTRQKKSHSAKKSGVGKWMIKYTGMSANNWKGDEVGYQGIHRWLSKTYGRADRCEKDDCTNKSTSYSWAKLRGKEYKRRRENFMRMCASCHIKYDKK
jgi:hypothetical protein